jgi:hypothetical protein
VLGVEPGGKVAFQIDEGQVRLVPVAFTLESAYGSVTPISRPEDFKQIAREARGEKVERTARTMSQEWARGR